ncbi:MAG: fibronectin type III domain-containing protein [Pseudomonadota bacterium]
MHRNRLRFTGTLLVMASLALILVSGCGKKAPPLPALRSIPGAPSMLKADFVQDRITLQWQPPPKTDNAVPLAGYEVSSAVRSLTDPCQGCPLIFRPVGTTAPDTCTFVFQGTRGNRYFFRVIAVAASRGMSDSSNAVSVELP